jgi:hypothetical protein
VTILRWCTALVFGGAMIGGPAVLAGPAFWNPTPTQDRPQSGMALLNDFPCRRGEVRRIEVRGAEDDFSPQGVEPGRRHERLPAGLLDAPGVERVGYDNPESDVYLLDHFTLPKTVARGLFVISLKPVLDDRNDSLLIGDALQWAGSLRSSTQPIFYHRTATLGSAEGWSRSGTLAYARLSDIQLRTVIAEPTSPAGTSLLDFVRTSGSGVFDVKVSDDTAVDFMGIAYCEEPNTHGGLTFAVHESGSGNIPITVAAGFPKASGRRGDPFVGDTDCSTALPLLCLRDQQRPAPAAFSQAGRLGSHEDLARQWTGGDLRLSSMVRGDTLATVQDADRRCRREFGAGWRVADFHAGGAGMQLVGFGTGAPLNQRAWVDIKDQPYGACWKRAPR